MLHRDGLDGDFLEKEKFCQIQVVSKVSIPAWLSKGMSPLPSSPWAGSMKLGQGLLSETERQHRIGS